MKITIADRICVHKSVATIDRSSTYEVDDNKMEDNIGKDEISERSLWTDAELALVSRVALDTQTNCRGRDYQRQAYNIVSKHESSIGSDHQKNQLFQS